MRAVSCPLQALLSELLLPAAARLDLVSELRELAVLVLGGTGNRTARWRAPPMRTRTSH